MRTGEKETIAEHLRKSGVSRRSFLQLCSKILVVAPVGLALTHKTTAAQVAKLVGKARRPQSSGSIFRTAPAVLRRCCAPRLPTWRI